MIERRQLLQVTENALAYLVAFAMLIYGAAKWLQFGDSSQNHTPVSQLTGMQLMWAFYGYSKPFAIIIGVLEITGGILIIFRKTRLIACALLSTILVNIILQDIFYEVNQGALRAAIIYQTAIIAILWRHKTTLAAAFKILVNYERIVQHKREMFVTFLLSILLFIVLRVIEFYLTAANF